LAFAAALLALIALCAPALTGVPAAGASTPALMFGIGDEVSGAQTAPIYSAAPVNMVTSWYNGPSDLSWMSGFNHTSQMSDLYGQGKAQELVVWLYNEPQYAISAQFQTDIKTLVQTFEGNGPHYGPLYVVLFTEFETYSSDPAYTAQLMTAYTSAVKVIHGTYSQAKVSLGFGGYDWGATYPVRNLAPYQSAIAASDFLSVQAMADCTDEAQLEGQIRASVAQLGTYHKSIMISHFKVWGAASCATAAFSTFEADMFNDQSLATLTNEGLFAWGFMNDDYINDPGPSFTTAVADIRRYSSGSNVSLPSSQAPSTSPIQATG